MSLALYAGSFDPITLGHIDIIRQALRIFDTVHVGVGQNPKKKRLIDGDVAVDLIVDALAETVTGEEFRRIAVGSYCGITLPDYAQEIEATVLVRGLRQVSDFNDEFVLHGILERVAPEFPVAYLIGQQQNLHVSSSTARELASFGKDVSWLVPPCVAKALNRAYAVD